MPLTGKKYIYEIIRKKMANKEPAFIYFKVDFNEKSFHVFDENDDAHIEYSFAKVK